LECPICYNVMGPPIYQCTSGHLMCSTCYARSTMLLCPCCRVQLNKIVPSRNLSLERIVELSELEYSCKNDNWGCINKFPWGKLKETHEAKCDFRCFPCPFEDCEDISIGAIVEHFSEVHNQVQNTEVEYHQTSGYRSGRSGQT
jgi:E3 ubiquitin-protein ligase SIAH1